MVSDRLLCENGKLIFKNKKIFFKENNLEHNEFNKKNSLVKYFVESDLENLNPYVRSLINFSALNLNNYNRKIKVFYAGKNSVKLDEIISFYFRKKYNVKKWDDKNRKNHLDAFMMICSFLGIQLEASDNYEDSNFVLVNFSDNTNFVGVSTFPYELDLYKILGKKMFIFYSNFESDSSRGSLQYFFFLHHLLHSFGLYHPISDNINQDLINNYSTLMCDDIDIDAIPRTLMPLDIEALKYLYNVSNFKLYSNWLDFGCKKGILQTLIGDISLNVVTNSGTFNLVLDNYILGQDVECMSNFVGDIQGGSVLGLYSRIKDVVIDCNNLNIYITKFMFDTGVVVNSNCKGIKIYVSGGDDDYEMSDEGRVVRIVSRKTGYRLIVDYGRSGVGEVDLFLMGGLGVSKEFDLGGIGDIMGEISGLGMGLGRKEVKFEGLEDSEDDF